MTTMKTAPAISFAIQALKEGGYVLEKMTVVMTDDGAGIANISVDPIAARTELYEVQELMAKQMAETFQVSPYRPPPQPQLAYQQPRHQEQRRPEPQPFMPGGNDYPDADPLGERPAILDNWTDKNGPQQSGALKNLKDRLTNGVNQRASAIAVFLMLASYSLAQRPII